MVVYSDKLATYVLGEIEKGRTLTSICREEGVPSHATIHKWVRDDYKGFGAKYQTSRETQLNYFIDQMHDIADAPPPVPPEFVRNDKGEMEKLEGTDRKLWVNAENQRRRLKVDAIKFQTAKLAGVMGHNLEKGITVQGDTINIINYATAPTDTIDIDAPEVKVKEVNFINTEKVNK
jgi:hypothetical protein